jgi:hypothetical protein
VNVACAFCGFPVDTNDPTSWEQQFVWVTGPKKHGACLAEKTGKHAHDACVKKEQAGVAPDQLALFDTDPTGEEQA